MTRRHIVRPSSQKLEFVLQSVNQSFGGKDAHTGRGQFDRKRQGIELLTDRCDRRCVLLRQRKPVFCSSRPLNTKWTR